MRELLIHQQKMRKDWEDKNIILGFMRDSLKGDIEVDGLEKYIWMAVTLKGFVHSELLGLKLSSMTL